MQCKNCVGIHHRIVLISKSGNRSYLANIDDAVICNEFVTDIDADDLAEDQTIHIVRGVAGQLDRLQILAFQMNRSFGDTRRFYDLRGLGGSSCQGQFIDIFRDAGRGCVHGFPRIPGRQVAHKLAGLLDVPFRILVVVVR